MKGEIDENEPRSFYVDSENIATFVFGGNNLKFMKSDPCLTLEVDVSVSPELQHPFPPQFLQFILDSKAIAE